jgi:hypothetical protein
LLSISTALALLNSFSLETMIISAFFVDFGLEPISSPMKNLRLLFLVK